MIMNKLLISIFLASVSLCVFPQEKKVFAGADESSPSRAQYFSWINNTNEGATEKQTLINLNFFAWLNREYGMQLDIYAFDAGAIDGKRFYGSIYSVRFKNFKYILHFYYWQHPNYNIILDYQDLY